MPLLWEKDEFIKQQFECQGQKVRQILPFLYRWKQLLAAFKVEASFSAKDYCKQYTIEVTVDVLFI